MTDSHIIIYLTRNEDGTYLVASGDSPRFCFQAATVDEARAKARRAIKYYGSAKKKIEGAAPRETRVLSPIYEKEELCDA